MRSEKAIRHTKCAYLTDWLYVNCTGVTANKLFIVFPIRILLDLIAMAKFTFADSPANGFAVLKALFSFVFRIRKTIATRSAVSNHYRMAGCYRKSIVVARFVGNKKKFSQLVKLP